MNKRKVTTLETKDKVSVKETKKTVKCITSSINFSRGKQYRCWWCTLPIDAEPIGCPVNINKNKTYSTTGCFCSFNCVKAYIIEKERTDVMYKHSHSLLAHMVCDMRGKIFPVSINPSPDKSLMSDYGGHMTEEQYKYCFDRILYTEKGIIQMFPTTSFFQEEEKITKSKHLDEIKYGKS